MPNKVTDTSPRAVNDALELRELLESGAARRIRLAADIPLRVVAADCHADPVSVHRWETGLSRPKGARATAYLACLRKMARALEASS